MGSRAHEALRNVSLSEIRARGARHGIGYALAGRSVTWHGIGGGIGEGTIVNTTRASLLVREDGKLRCIQRRSVISISSS